jgi:cellulose synthase/poly-beta-1,6-N-acetylglucosamine synthase-like glycosyltransferase
MFNLKEIIVVASGCTDRTEEIIKEYTKIHGKVKLIVEKGRKGKASAVNIIFKEAVGDIIVFIDGDDLTDNKSICELIKPIEINNILVTTGRMVPKRNGPKLIDFLNSFIWKLHHRISINQSKVSGQFFAIKRNLIKKIYPRAVCDDAFITGILRKKNVKIAYIPEAVVYIETPLNIINLLKQRRRIAVGYNQLRLMGFDISFSLFYTIKALIEESRIFINKINKITLIVLLEIAANLLALYDILRGNIQYCWEDDS